MLLLISIISHKSCRVNHAKGKLNSYLLHQAFLVYLNVFQRYQKRDLNLLMDHPENEKKMKLKKFYYKKFTLVNLL